MQYKKSPFDSEIRRRTRALRSGKYGHKKETRRPRSRFLLKFRQKLAIKNKRLLIAAGVFAVLLIWVYVIALTPLFKISTVHLLEGVEKSNNLAYQQVASRFRGKNLLFTSKREIIDQFLFVNARLNQVDVDRDWPHTLVITLAETPIVAKIKIVSHGATQSLLLNEQGLLVDSEIDEEMADELPEIEVETDAQPVINRSFISVDNLNKFLQANDLYEQMLSMKVKSIKYVPVAHEIHLLTERDFWLWIDLDKDIERQITKLKDAIPKLNIYEDNFDYIDLRIAGEGSDRIFLKRK